MIIDYDKDVGVYFGRLRFDERTLLKQGGWLWSIDRKRWETRDAAKARALVVFATDAAVAALKALDRASLSWVEMSKATECDAVIPAPPGLAYDPYQIAGIVYHTAKKDSLNADPPGLGKTIQAIGTANNDPSIRRVLIVCPGGLAINWLREWKKWDVKGLSADRVRSLVKRAKVMNDDGSPALTEMGNQKYRSWTEKFWPEADVVVISYDMLDVYEEEVRSRTWDLLICDEAHALATEGTIRTRQVFGAGKQRVKRKNAEGKLVTTMRPAVAPIPAQKRIFLTGTPILSRPLDIWTLCRACDPAGLGKNWMTFVRQYCDAKGMFGRLDTSGASNLEELQYRMRHAFMVRRDKTTVLSQLPPKRRQLIELPSDGLAKLLDREVSAARAVRDALATFEREIRGEVEEEKPWEGLMVALEKRFGHLAHLDYEERAATLSPGEKASFEEFSQVRRDLAAAKVPMVREFLDDALANGEKVICFVYHKEMARALKAHFGDAAYVTGEVPVGRRQAQIDRFQEDENCRLAIGNLTAMGVGYTMTASARVVFGELDFVPWIIEQAEDRAWRRGQLNAVLAQHLVVEGSVEARLVEIIIEKMDITDRALNDKRLKEFAPDDLLFAT